MRLSTSALVLLDTSVLVHLARQDATGRWVESEYSLTTRAERPLIDWLDPVIVSVHWIAKVK